MTDRSGSSATDGSGSSAAGGSVSRPAAAPTPRPRRPRRQRSVSESLLSIVLLLEAIVLFFVALVFFGLKTFSPGVAFGGAAGFIVVILIAIVLLRWPIGVAIGWVVQAALIALGILNPVMYLVGAGFAAFWIWCFVRARQIDAKQREYLAAHPELADPPTSAEASAEGDTP